jgi:hypothetical protein
MKKNLLKAFELQLEYNLNLHTHITNVSCKSILDCLEVTITPNDMGTYQNVDLIYSILNKNLASYVNIVRNNMIISIF